MNIYYLPPSLRVLLQTFWLYNSVVCAIRQVSHSFLRCYRDIYDKNCALHIGRDLPVILILLLRDVQLKR